MKRKNKFDHELECLLATRTNIEGHLELIAKAKILNMSHYNKLTDWLKRVNEAIREAYERNEGDKEVA